MSEKQKMSEQDEAMQEDEPMQMAEDMQDKPCMKMSEDEDEVNGVPSQEEDDQENVAPEKYKLRLDQERRKNRKFSLALNEMQQKVAGLERKARIAERTSDLISLESEGVLFDMASAVERLADLEPKKYSLELDLMRKHYQRAPITSNLTPMIRQVAGTEYSTFGGEKPAKTRMALLCATHSLY